jgi:tetratricopeptide (TPR) repeat protein
MYKRLSVLLLLCTTLTVFGGDSNDHWLEVKSPHFTVLTNSNNKQAIRIASQFEQMRSVFQTLLPNAPSDAGSPIVVLALKSRKDFQALEPQAYLSKGQLDLAGLFMRAPDKNYILLRLDGENEHPFAVVYHEYTHYIMRKSTWMPLWLNEGLAEFYQNTDIHEKEVLLGQPSSDDILFLRQNRLLPLTTLLKVDYTSPYYHDEQKGSVFYAESWALTHYLEVNDYEKNTNRVRDYAKFLSQNEDPVTAAQHAFGDLDLLQKALNSYVQQGSFSMFKRNSGVVVDESAFQLRIVPKPEIDAVRADVLVYNDRTKEAEALLETSLSSDPNNALAHETMGYLKYREGDIAGAKKWYGEAVQLDSHSYLAHYYFAAMSLQTGGREHDEAIESSLRASIKLNPSFAPAYDTLAMFYASRNQQLSEAHMLNAQAIQLEPENLNYRINAAAVLSQQQQYSSATMVLKAAKEVAKTPGEIATLDNRVKQLEQFQSQMDRAQQRNNEASTQVTVTQTARPSGAQPDNSKTVVFRKVDGKMMGTMEEAPKYPDGDSKGPRHMIQGIIRNVQCSYPNVIALKIEQGGKSVSLYNNNYYKVVFTLTNYETEGDLKPCSDIEGMKAKVGYAEVSDSLVAGQIMTIELTK